MSKKILLKLHIVGLMLARPIRLLEPMKRGLRGLNKLAGVSLIGGP
jgi:hypothetical protein